MKKPVEVGTFVYGIQDLKGLIPDPVSVLSLCVHEKCFMRCRFNTCKTFRFETSCRYDCEWIVGSVMAFPGCFFFFSYHSINAGIKTLSCRKEKEKRRKIYVHEC